MGVIQQLGSRVVIKLLLIPLLFFAPESWWILQIPLGLYHVQLLKLLNQTTCFQPHLACLLPLLSIILSFFFKNLIFPISIAESPDLSFGSSIVFWMLPVLLTNLIICLLLLNFIWCRCLQPSFSITWDFDVYWMFFRVGSLWEFMWPWFKFW